MQTWKLSIALVMTLGLIALVHTDFAVAFDDPDEAVRNKTMLVDPPAVVLASAEQALAKSPQPAIYVKCGAHIVLPGDWGRPGSVSVIVDRAPTAVRVFEWTKKGIRAQLPTLPIVGEKPAQLVVVREYQRSFPAISIKLVLTAAPAAAMGAPAPEPPGMSLLMPRLYPPIGDGPAGTFDDAIPEDIR